MAVEKEFWIGKILENPIPDGSFLNESEDWSMWSDGHTLHFAEAGMPPAVLVDNVTYPIGVVKRDDVPKEIPLHTYDTENTQHTNVEKAEESDEKANSITNGHKTQIYQENCKLALFNWCPQKNSEKTPVLETTGATVTEDGVTRKRLTYADVIRLASKFRKLKFHASRKILCLCTEHLEDLQLEDVERYRKALENGKISDFFVYDYPDTPTYSATTKEKEAYSSAKSANSMPTSVAWVKTEVMRCAGEVKAFVSENDPQYRGDLLGFQKRFTALSLRNFGIGAIYSAKA